MGIVPIFLEGRRKRKNLPCFPCTPNFLQDLLQAPMAPHHRCRPLDADAPWSGGKRGRKTQIKASPVQIAI